MTDEEKGLADSEIVGSDGTSCEDLVNAFFSMIMTVTDDFIKDNLKRNPYFREHDFRMSK